jgi:peptide/nickel transport system permease protein
MDTQIAYRRVKMHRFLRNPSSWLFLGLSLAVILVAVSGAWLAPRDPLAVKTSDRFQSPGSQYWMGTDNLGRDVLSRSIAGTRLALQSCGVILVSATLLGLLIGVVSGYYGGVVDEVAMRISDIFIAFPGLVLALAIAAALGPNLTHAMIAISAVWWPSYARLVRGQVLAIKKREFIQAARALGASDLTIMWAHIIPNIAIPLLIQVTSDIGPALVTTSSLSFIGMGAQPPTPEWGSMVSLGRKYLLDYWWMSTFPGLAIFITVVIFNGLGETIRTSLSPRR